MILVLALFFGTLLLIHFKVTDSFFSHVGFILLYVWAGLILAVCGILLLSYGGQFGHGVGYQGDTKESYKLEKINDDYRVILSGGDATVVIKDDQGLPSKEKFYEPTILKDGAKAGTVEIRKVSNIAPYLFVPWDTYYHKHATIYISGSDVEFSG